MAGLSKKYHLHRKGVFSIDELKMPTPQDAASIKKCREIIEAKKPLAANSTYHTEIIDRTIKQLKPLEKKDNLNYKDIETAKSLVKSAEDHFTLLKKNKKEESKSKREKERTLASAGSMQIESKRALKK
jgi:hypothetical protein